MNAIKTDICKKCGKRFDPIQGECPECHEKGRYFEFKESFKNHPAINTWRNIVIFIIGWLGFQLVGTIVSLITQIVWTIQNPGLSGQALIKYLEEKATSPEGMALVNFPTYFLIVVAIFGIINVKIPTVFKNWGKIKPYLIGLLAGAALIGFSYLYSLFLSTVNPGGGGNANQTRIVKMVGTFPVLSLICLGLLGPLSEEFTYRLGCFSFFARINKVLAFCLTGLIFGLIHFDFGSIGTNSFVNEILNLPDYIIAGLALCFVYDKFGLAASFTAHATNNLFSVIVIIISNSK